MVSRLIWLNDNAEFSTDTLTSKGLCITPLKSLSFAKEIGLDTITYEEYPGDQLDQVMTVR